MKKNRAKFHLSIDVNFYEDKHIDWNVINLVYQHLNIS